MYACMFARIIRNEKQKEIVNKNERQNCVIFFPLRILWHYLYIFKYHKQKPCVKSFITCHLMCYIPTHTLLVKKS